MRSQLDEFESVFKQSLRRTVNIEQWSLERILVVLDVEGNPVKRKAVLDCSVEVVDRFRVPALVLVPDDPRMGDEARTDSLLQKAVERLRATGTPGISGKHIKGSPAKIILGEIADYKPSLIIMSSLFGEDDEFLESYTLGSVADRVLSSIREPMLLVEGEVPDPARLWKDIIVYVDQPETVEPCLSAVLSLAEKGAHVTLYHVLDESWLAVLRKGAELAVEIDTETAQRSIVDSLRRDMKHFFCAAAQALSRTGHKVETCLEVGDPIELTRNRIREHEHGLLLCNSVAPDQKLIDSVAYNLAAYLREIPLLLV